MNKKKTPSRLTYKIAGIIAVVFAILSFITILFAIPGLFLLFLGIKYLKIAKSMKPIKLRVPDIPKKDDTIITPPPKERPAIESKPIEDNTIVKTYRVAGTSFRLKNIMELANENPQYEYTKQELIDECLYDEKIFEYEFYPIKTELIPEPDNPYDKNAVKVIVDGEHIGYIKEGSCSHVLRILREHRIKKIECEISGGKYKRLCYDEDEDSYTMEKSESIFYAQLTIIEIK